jgi:hypothetical protein
MMIPQKKNSGNPSTSSHTKLVVILRPRSITVPPPFCPSLILQWNHPVPRSLSSSFWHLSCKPMSWKTREWPQSLSALLVFQTLCACQCAMAATPGVESIHARTICLEISTLVTEALPVSKRSKVVKFVLWRTTTVRGALRHASAGEGKYTVYCGSMIPMRRREVPDTPAIFSCNCCDSSLWFGIS